MKKIVLTIMAMCCINATAQKIQEAELLSLLTPEARAQYETASDEEKAKTLEEAISAENKIFENKNEVEKVNEEIFRLRRLNKNEGYFLVK